MAKATCINCGKELGMRKAKTSAGYLCADCYRGGANITFDHMVVIAGDYEGKGIIATANKVQIATSFGECLELNKDNVASYEVITEDHAKSAVSGAARGLVGGALLGPVGLLAGALSAKNKGLYHIVVQFKDGKNSLLEMSDKSYNTLIKVLF